MPSLLNQFERLFRPLPSTREHLVAHGQFKLIMIDRKIKFIAFRVSTTRYLMAKRTDESYFGRLDGNGKTGFNNTLGTSTSEKTTH